MNKYRNEPMKIIKLLLIIFSPLLLVFVFCGSSIAEEHSYQSSEQVHMEHLTKLLTRRDIPFESTGGLIRYNSTVKVEFEKALKAMDSVATVQFNDTEVKNHFHSILYNEDIEYIESVRDDGSWTLWWPGSEERRLNILDQVIEYKIALQMEQKSDCDSDSSKGLSTSSFLQDALNNSANK